MWKAKPDTSGAITWYRCRRRRTLADLNAQLLAGCRADERRKIGDRVQTVGEGMQIEQPHLLALSTEGFPLAEDSFPRVDGKGCVRVRNNFYSAPVKAGTVVRASVFPATWRSGTMADAWRGMSEDMETASTSSIWNIIWRCWSGSGRAGREQASGAMAAQGPMAEKL